MVQQLYRITFARRERPQLARGMVPAVAWAGLLVGAVLTIGFKFFGVSMRA